MCDRYSLRTKLVQLADDFAITQNRTLDLATPIEFLPGQFAPVVRLTSNGQRSLSNLRWGLAPNWPSGNDLEARKITARAEFLTQTPAYRVLVRRSRCLVPVDGFYETPEPGTQLSQDSFTTLRQDRTFALAGLWDEWVYGEKPVATFTVITVATDPWSQNSDRRIPAILARTQYSQWLSPQTHLDDVLACLRPYPEEALYRHPISHVFDRTSVGLEPVAA